MARLTDFHRQQRRSNRPPLDSRLSSCFAVVGACVLRLLVVFVHRTSSTPVATRFWQTEGRSAERVILGVRPSEFILSEFQSPSRRIFITTHSLPPLWSPNRSFIYPQNQGRAGTTWESSHEWRLAEATPSTRGFQWFTRKPLGSLVDPQSQDRRTEDGAAAAPDRSDRWV
jgi:hypothetical protein